MKKQYYLYFLAFAIWILSMAFGYGLAAQGNLSYEDLQKSFHTALQGQPDILWKIENNGDSTEFAELRFQETNYLIVKPTKDSMVLEMEKLFEDSRVRGLQVNVVTPDGKHSRLWEKYQVIRFGPQSATLDIENQGLFLDLFLSLANDIWTYDEELGTNIQLKYIAFPDRNYSTISAEALKQFPTVRDFENAVLQKFFQNKKVGNILARQKNLSVFYNANQLIIIVYPTIIEVEMQINDKEISKVEINPGDIGVITLTSNNRIRPDKLLITGDPDQPRLIFLEK